MISEQFIQIDETRLRTGYGVKWGSLRQDTIGAWVADMDFGIPPAVREKIMEVTQNQDFGYPFWSDGDPVVLAFEDRMRRRYRWTPQPERTRIFTDLIQILQVVIEHATKPSDGIAIHVPSYPPFLASIERSGRRIIPIPMVNSDNGWVFSTDNLTQTLRDQQCTMLVLVNPHNPTGRVFTATELHDLGAVAEELDLTVLADEIHADLTFTPYTHIPFASLNYATAGRSITATSATKAFNIAGMRCAVAHIGSDRVWNLLAREPLDYFGTPSILSRVATLAAWNESDAWLLELLEQLQRNRCLVAEWVETSGVDPNYRSPEATYLSWIDFTNSPLNQNDPAADIFNFGKVLLSKGEEFSRYSSVDSMSFARLNFATSEANLQEILQRFDITLQLAAAW